VTNVCKIMTKSGRASNFVNLLRQTEGDYARDKRSMHGRNKILFF